MGISIRLLKICFIVLLVSGCARPMVVLDDVDENHAVYQTLTKDQMKESILEGAWLAHWKAQDQGPDAILATYIIRRHTVNVQIKYTESSYTINYKSSYGMKMYCTKNDLDKKLHKVVSGVRTCPGGMPPYAIHKAYQAWVDELNRAIRTSIESE